MAPSPRDGDLHSWVRVRLDAHALGLLDEAEERSLLDHAAVCQSCGEALKVHSENAPRLAREGHIPAALLARWDRARHNLRGMARRMVREHLETCAECRQDLEAVGFRPELEVLPDENAEEPLAVTSRPFTVDRGRGWSWSSAIAGAALATAATLIVVSVVRPPTPTIPPPGIDSAPPPLSPTYLLEPLPPTGRLPAATRDGGGSPLVIPVAPATRYVHLELPDLFLADSATVDLRVTGPTGSEVARERRRFAELTERRTLLLGSPSGPLAHGEYHLTITAPFASSPLVAEFQFHLAPTGPR